MCLDAVTRYLAPFVCVLLVSGALFSVSACGDVCDAACQTACHLACDQTEESCRAECSEIWDECEEACDGDTVCVDECSATATRCTSDHCYPEWQTCRDGC